MRTSGILLPIFSLPGKYGIGCLSQAAYDFVDFLEKSKQTYWQILPLGPTSYGDSPYQSFSTFATNPYFISLEALVNEGLLTDKECAEVNFGKSENHIDYEILYRNRLNILRKAFERANYISDKEYEEFIKENEYWIEDYALYMSIKNHFDDVCFIEWDEDIRMRSADALERYKAELSDDISFYKFLQYKFMQQWMDLKKYANNKNIKIIGDIPIYVSYDSAEAWAHPELFELDEAKNLISVAGCPPDGFSADGQLWGNPIYNWDYHNKTDFAWWKLRMKKCKELYDVIRIDHFRGFDEFYSIPADEKTAKNGKWRKGPGISLFNSLKDILSDINIIAEDLGFVTDSVKKLVLDTGFPNMKVLEFAFDERDTGNSSDYLPHNYTSNSVVYTGTHDNETIIGWLGNITEKELSSVKNYFDYHGDDATELADKIIRYAQLSVADTCIIPMQDYLHLDNRARINTPSTLGNNWVWRMRQEDLDESLAERIGSLTMTYGRG